MLNTRPLHTLTPFTRPLRPLHALLRSFIKYKLFSRLLHPIQALYTPFPSPIQTPSSSYDLNFNFNFIDSNHIRRLQRPYTCLLTGHVKPPETEFFQFTPSIINRQAQPIQTQLLSISYTK